MNKQQLLDIENPTTEQAVMQQLLATGSKTSLNSDARVLRRLTQSLPKTKMKQLPLETILKCVEDSAALAEGTSIMEAKDVNKPAKTA